MKNRETMREEIKKRYKRLFENLGRETMLCKHNWDCHSADPHCTKCGINISDLI